MPVGSKPLKRFPLSPTLITKQRGDPKIGPVFERSGGAYSMQKKLHSISDTGDGHIQIHFNAELSMIEKVILDGLVAAHKPQNDSVLVSNKKEPYISPFTGKRS